MSVSARSYLAAGVAVIGASAIAIAPTVAPLPDIQVAADSSQVKPAVSHEMVELAAAAQQMAAAASAIAATADTSGATTAQTPSTAAVAPQALPPTGPLIWVADAIDNTYEAVEPWVRWGFDVAEWAVSWIPVVGWLAPQISMLYDFGESLVHSAVFNTTDWLRGDGGIFTNVVDFGREAVNALVDLGVNEFNWAFGGLLPPLPPFPRLPVAATQTSTLAASALPDVQSMVKSVTANGPFGKLAVALKSGEGIFDTLRTSQRGNVLNGLRDYVRGRVDRFTASSKEQDRSTMLRSLRSTPANHFGTRAGAPWKSSVESVQDTARQPTKASADIARDFNDAAEKATAKPDKPSQTPRKSMRTGSSIQTGMSTKSDARSGFKSGATKQADAKRGKPTRSAGKSISTSRSGQSSSSANSSSSNSNSAGKSTNTAKKHTTGTSKKTKSKH